ncbi:MAG: 2-oxoacid:acceptor oxidoreductase subunit alpha [Candidatus Omnitrophica bacterium]|nr:2-oxoacid:acceptor oxidoreductase subunit alpha [Candidatus Omnitrophota bacterium]
MVDYVFRVGGEGGEGVISTGEMLTLDLARSGFEIYTFRTYPAEIKGGHANYQIRASGQLLLSQGDAVDVLLAFNQEAYDKHAKDIRPGGVLVYDSDSYIPPPVAAANGGAAAQAAGPSGQRTGGGNIPALVNSTVLYGVPLTSLATEQVGVKLTKNIIALGFVAELCDIPRETFEALLREKFGRKGETVVQKNLQALHIGMDYVKQVARKDSIKLGAGPRKTKELILSGNEALALGAIAAGCRFYAGYPITPATDIMEFLAKELPKIGGFVVQTEDEIAALGAVLGASFTGKKAMTATSGPGFSLMTEMMGLAVAAEIPAVVVDVQRVGPSTGMPTKTEQGDFYLACYGGHGNCPRVVMALTSVEDCFYGIMRAFNLAEQFQMPVVVLSDQYLGHRKATVPVFEIAKVPVVNRRTPTAQELVGYKRYRFTPDSISPMAMPGMEGGGYIAEGLEHDEGGYPAASNHEMHLRSTKKRYAKWAAVEPVANELVRIYGEPHPEIGIIGWGSSEGVIREAVQLAQAKGYSVGALHPKILYPAPLAKLKEFIDGTKAVIVAEVNYTGQFATALRKRFAYDFIQLNKCVGLPFTPKEIVDKIEEVAAHVRSGHRDLAAKL